VLGIDNILGYWKILYGKSEEAAQDRGRIATRYQRVRSNLEKSQICFCDFLPGARGFFGRGGSLSRSTLSRRGAAQFLPFGQGLHAEGVWIEVGMPEV
jgi:hypothetical protein